MGRLLLLNPPSYPDFDGGAGSRFQTSREVASFWYPIWLCYPAGMVADSRVVDAPVEGFDLEQTLAIAKDYDLVLIYTSTPSLLNDAGVAAAIKSRSPGTRIGFCGPQPTVLPEETFAAAPAIDFVCRDEFDYSIRELAEGAALAEVDGVSWRRDGEVVHNPKRPIIQDLDALPWVSKVYKRDLPVEKYNIPWLKKPYVSIYSSRGCPARCTFCLWPQTTSGHPWRKRSVEDVVNEFEYVIGAFPNVQDVFFDDDTFSLEPGRTIEISRRLRGLGMTWGGNARGNLDYETLREMRAGGCRVLMVGYESGSDRILKNIKKGITVRKLHEFTLAAKKAGLKIHGAFILGLPGETPETIEETIRFACELDVETIQVSLAAPYPGTEFYDWARRKGFLAPEVELVGEHGYQDCKLEYPEISSIEIFKSVERFYRRFYFRPKYLARQIFKMAFHPKEGRRLLHEGREFKQWQSKRQEYLANAQQRIANRGKLAGQWEGDPARRPSSSSVE